MRGHSRGPRKTLSRERPAEPGHFHATPLPALTYAQWLQGRELGVAKLRLLPKMTGMRPIVNLGKPSRVLLPGAGTSAGALLTARQGPGAGAAAAAAGGSMHSGSGQVAGVVVGGKRRGREARRARPMPLLLSFKPVNMVLQNVHQVWASSCVATSSASSRVSSAYRLRSAGSVPGS